MKARKGGGCCRRLLSRPCGERGSPSSNSNRQTSAANGKQPTTQKNAAAGPALAAPKRDKNKKYTSGRAKRNKNQQENNERVREQNKNQKQKTAAKAMTHRLDGRLGQLRRQLLLFLVPLGLGLGLPLGVRLPLAAHGTRPLALLRNLRFKN